MLKTAEEVAVRKSVRVAVPVERAFSVFVEQMETWWPASHHIAQQAFQTIVAEPRTGGRWYERDAQGHECDWGTVLAWEPPHRVTFGWHLQPDWKYDPDPTKASEVAICFKADGAAGTLVELEHSKLERHGSDPAKLRAMFEGPNAWEEIFAHFAKALTAR